MAPGAAGGAASSRSRCLVVDPEPSASSTVSCSARKCCGYSRTKAQSLRSPRSLRILGLAVGKQESSLHPPSSRNSWASSCRSCGSLGSASIVVAGAVPAMMLCPVDEAPRKAKINRFKTTPVGPPASATRKCYAARRHHIQRMACLSGGCVAKGRGTMPTLVQKIEHVRTCVAEQNSMGMACMGASWTAAVRSASRGTKFWRGWRSWIPISPSPRMKQCPWNSRQPRIPFLGLWRN